MSGTGRSAKRPGCSESRLGGELGDKFDFINGVTIEMSGRRLARLARVPGLDHHRGRAGQLLDSGSAYGQLKYSSKQLWAYESGVSMLWYATPTDMPAIAIVDSGIDTTLPDFAGRNIKQVDFVSSGKTNGARRRSWSRQLRRRDRGGLGGELRRRGSERSARLARRHGRLRLRPDE